MKVAVVGAGAMGSLFGGYLCVAGHEVWLVDTWAEHVQAIRERGLCITEPSGEEKVVRPYVVDDVAVVGPSELVLVFVKSYHTAPVAAALGPLLMAGSAVLTLQNGLGNVEVLAQNVPRRLLLAGTTGQGANVLGPGRIHHAGHGETIVGELDGTITERLERVVAVFQAAGLPASASANVQGVIWTKLLVNVAINPLTAILRVRNGRLLEIPETVELMKEAVSEAVLVAERAGVHLSCQDPWAHVEDVTRRTGRNRSSMLQDMEAGRRTEIEVINGAVVREGARLGLSTPVNLVLTRLVRAMQGHAHPGEGR